MEAANTSESEYLSRNFKRKELECPCCSKCEMNPVLLTRLQTLRDILGFPLVITSGYRCERHNREVGGAVKSQHLLGNAVDISTHDLNASKRYNVMRSAMSVSFKGVGISKAFLHLDIRGIGSKIWIY